MGAGGPLKLPPLLAAVPDLPAGATAADVTGTAASRVASGRAAPPAGSGAWPKPLRALFKQVADQLEDAGLSGELDGMALEMACRHFLAARLASDALTKGQIIVRDSHGEKKNPAGAEMRSQSLAFLEYSKQLGLTFVSRARTPLDVKSAGEEENPFA